MKILITPEKKTDQAHFQLKKKKSINLLKTFYIFLI